MILAAQTAVNKVKTIIWLASYPKSGNTWFRLFLANLERNSNEPADINQLDRTLIASARTVFDNTMGIASSDLTHHEIDRLRPDMYRTLAAETKEPLFLKIHDAYTYVDGHKALVPPEVTRGVIYFVRNPLDIAVSFANHSGISIDKSIRHLNDESFGFCDSTDKLESQLRQRLLSWSGHVRSWTEARALNIHVMRYEDMKQDPQATFTSAARFAGLDFSPERIAKALQLSSFKEIQRQEQEQGFREKAPSCGSFFYKGETGYWRDVLSGDQEQAIVNAHGEVMKRFGYL